jgi:hypothetical protein
MLSNHQHQRKIVHSKRSIKKFVGVDKEDDIFNSILDQSRFCAWVMVEYKNQTLEVFFKPFRRNSNDKADS